MTINILMFIYIGENAHWDIYAPPCKSLHKNLFPFFFHFRCILLQISHKNVFLKVFLYSGVPGLNVKFTYALDHRNVSCYTIQKIRYNCDFKNCTYV